MGIRKLLASFWRRKPSPSSEPDTSSLSHIRATLAMVAQTQEQELGCDEVYALLDILADRVSRGEDVATLMPLVYHHLQICPDCREEFDALLRAVEAPSG
jgi:hypothetical protein